VRDIVGPAHLGCPAYIVKLRIRYHSPLTAASWPHQDRRGCGAQPLPGPAAPPCPRRAGPAGRPAHRWGKSLLPCGRQRRRARLNRAGAPLNHVRRWAHFPAWDRRPPNFEQPRMNDLPTARPSEHPDWRAPTRSFIRFQAGAEKSRNAAVSFGCGTGDHRWTGRGAQRLFAVLPPQCRPRSAISVRGGCASAPAPRASATKCLALKAGTRAPRRRTSGRYSVVVIPTYLIAAIADAPAEHDAV
jgi:hypothetical protein